MQRLSGGMTGVEFKEMLLSAGTAQEAVPAALPEHHRDGAI